MPGKRYRERILPKITTLDPLNMQNFVQHLAKERGFLETIFNTIKEAVIVIDAQLKILYHNAAAKEMLGLPDELERLPMNKILKGVNWDTLLPSGGRTESGGDGGNSLQGEAGANKLLRQELEISYPEHRIVQFYALPLENSESQYAIILNDITDTLEKAATDAESERSKIVSMLAAGVAHEIGNPLNSLYLHLQFFQRLLNSDDFDREEIIEGIADARREVERLDSIINQFLHAIRPGKPEFHAIDLKNLLLEALHFMKYEIASRMIKVNFLWGDEVPLISGDANQLKQAFYNLVKNAVQSMKQNGVLGISCSADDDFVVLSVSDSGCGIRKQDMNKIFMPYFTTKGSTGNGLGLMIVERIVREHGASLSVDSEEGEGTTFTISFPRRERMVKVLPPPEAQ